MQVDLINILPTHKSFSTMIESSFLFRLINKPYQHFRSIFKKDIFNSLERKKIILKYLPPDPIIIDAGAHDGYESVEFSKLCPSAKIIGFEPVKEIYEVCLKNVKDIPSISVYNNAIGAKQEITMINIIDGFDGSASLFEPDTEKDSLFGGKRVKQVPIEVVRLDSWARIHQIIKIDFLWLDLQGYELMALEGMGDMIKETTAVYMEVMFKPSYKGQPLYSDVNKFMLSKGFKLAKKYFYYGTQGDVLYVRS